MKIAAPLPPPALALRPITYAVALTSTQSSNSTTRPIEGPGRVIGEAASRRIVGGLIDIRA